MNITKCDVCGKAIEDDQEVHIRHNLLLADICLKCAKPIVALLKKHKLIKIEK
jgi:hypothetical protein